MQIYNYDALTGEYIGETTADESPLEPGIFLIPANATTTAPPNTQAGKTINFQNGAWVFIDIPVLEPEPEPQTKPEVKPKSLVDAIIEDQAELTKLKQALGIA